MDERAIETMTEQRLEENKHNRWIYKKESDEHKAEQITSAIRHRAYQLQTMQERGKVNLSDLAAVIERTNEYMESCSRASSFPTAMGLAVCYGYSLRSLNTWLDNHAQSAVCEYIEKVKDIFADLLTDKSLTGEANTIQAIFQLKNHYGHRDQVDVKPVQDNALQVQTREQLEEKYKYLLDDDEG